jgi:PIN domain nuclease of toxin-antitoxin system
LSYLFDTRVLVRALREPERLTPRIAAIIDDHAEDRFFSVAAIWEIALVAASAAVGPPLDPRLVRTTLLDGGLKEIGVAGVHVLALADLPPIHQDPFDRMMLAQAKVEGMALVTTDKELSLYPVKVIVA